MTFAHVHEHSASGDVRDCPHFDGFDPLVAEQNADPFGWFERARREVPVFYMPQYDMWAVTRHADNVAVYRDHATFSNVGINNLRVAPPSSMAGEIPEGYVFPLSVSQILVTDPPRHTLMRKLLQPRLTKKSIDAREGEVRGVANRLIDGFVGDGRAELMDAFAFRLPTAVFADFFDLPMEATPDIFRWASDYFRLAGTADVTEAEAVERWRGILEFDAWARAFVADRRANPRDDLTTDLIFAVTDDGSPALTDDEILANVIGLLIGGVDSTAHLIGQAVYELLASGLWSQLAADHSLVPRAVEETLRLHGPIRGMRRTATRDVELGGTMIPKGALVWIVNQSANRDPEAFADPDSFDLGRTNLGEHLGLGRGAHFCIGAPLARLEARIALESLMDRLPGLRLSNPQGELDYLVSMIMPGLRSLEVEWDR